MHPNLRGQQRLNVGSAGGSATQTPEHSVQEWKREQPWGCNLNPKGIAIGRDVHYQARFNLPSALAFHRRLVRNVVVGREYFSVAIRNFKVGAFQHHAPLQMAG